MTENERMSISGLLDVLNTGISLSTCHMEYAIQSNVLEDLISCLEELQQYRAIGLTPELIEAMQGHNIALINDLGEYQQIGTIEEFKALKEKNEPKKLNNSLEEDGKIGGYCPNCNGTVLIRKTFLRTSKGKCCDWCGQKLDFGKEE